MIDMTQDSERKQLLKFAIPALFGVMIQQSYHVFDRIIVGRFLGEKSLAAVGNGAQIAVFLAAMATGLTFGSTVLISQYFGIKDRAKIKSTISTTYITMAVIAIIITVIGILCSRSILLLLRTPMEIIEESTEYLQLIFLGTISMFGYNATAAILRGMGDARTPLLFLLFSVIFSATLNFYFINNLSMGVEGTALASIISQTISFVYGLCYLYKNNNFFKLTCKWSRNMIKKIISCVTFDLEIFKKVIGLGVPTSIQKISVAVGMLVIQMMVNGFGIEVLAGFVSATALENVVLMPMMEFSLVVATFTGQNIAAKRMDRVFKGFKIVFWAAVVSSICISVVFYMFVPQMLSLFLKEGTSGLSFNTGLEYIQIVAPFLFIATCQFVVTGVLRGAGDAIFPMVLTILATLMIRIPVAYFFSTILGSTGIWWATPISWIVGCSVSIIYYFHGHWKKKIVI